MYQVEIIRFNRQIYYKQHKHEFDRPPTFKTGGIYSFHLSLSILIKNINLKTCITYAHRQKECLLAETLVYIWSYDFFQAPGEAEAQCAALVKAGKVYATGTEDMDALTFGTTVLLRNLTVAEARSAYILLKTKVTKNRHCCIFLYFIIWCIEKIICNEYYISASHGFSFPAIGRFGMSLISSAICIKLDVGTK